MNLKYLASTAATAIGIGLSALAGSAGIAEAAPSAPPPPCPNCEQGPGHDVPLQDPPKMGGGPESGGRSYEVPGQPLQDRAPANFAFAPSSTAGVRI